MCVSLSQYVDSNRRCRRCTLSSSQVADASARRQENRVTMRTARGNVRRMFGGDAAAAAVGNLSPSMLSNLLVSLEAVAPGVSSDILRTSNGALRRVPGMHNDVFSEVRE
ncbi:MAG: hypothetical protein WAV90_06040, partial [Gordonia amarae]